MARCYRALQALGPAETYLERALAWARTLGAADQAVEILCLLAETSCSLAELHAQDDSRRSHAALERTRDWAFEATGLAGHVADPQWEIKVLLRISDVLDRCGDHDDAVQLQSRAMRLMYSDARATAEADFRRGAAPAPAPRRCACRPPPPAPACPPAPRARPRRRLRAPGR